MDLPLFKQPTPDTNEKLYLAIQLAEMSVQSALWQVGPQGIRLLHRSEVHQFKDEADCVVKTDESLQELGKESENVNEVVFGVPPSWVEADGIASVKKPLLKKITDDLSLTAIGFVVTTEAVIQEITSSPSYGSSLLVTVTPTSMGISLLANGKIKHTEKVGKSGDTVADLTEALARLKQTLEAGQSLPAKVVFFSAELSEEEVVTEEQAFINHDWVAGGWFLHPPVVETLKSQAVMEAIVKQGGKAVAAAKGVVPPPAAEVQVSSKPSETNEFGFDEVTFEEATKSPTEATEPVERAVPDDNLQPVAAKSFGIPFGSPVAAPVVPPGMAATPGLADESETALPDATAPTAKKGLPSFKVPSFAGLWKKVQAEEKQIAHHPFIAAGVILGILALIGGGWLYLKMTATAVVAVTLKTVPVAKDVTIALDTQSSTVDTAQLTLPAQVTSKDVSGSESVPTTGVKLVGEKAKGKVTLFNKTTSSKVFAAGTTLTSGKYQFTLDQEATVASASVTSNGSGETKTYGKAEVDVTAAAIGAESNIGKDTELKIASFDPGTYSASVLEGLAGGSSREVQVVAEADRTKVLALVRDKLLKQAETEFKQSSGNGTFTVPTGRMVVKDTTYSAKVGDEAEQLSLELSATVEGATYKSSDLAPLAQAVLQSEIPAGYEPVQGEPTILSAPDSASSPSAAVKLQANLSSQARPKVATDVWQREIAGLSVTAAQEKLATKPEVASVTIEMMPKIAKTIVRSLPAAAKISFSFK